MSQILKQLGFDITKTTMLSHHIFCFSCRGGRNCIATGSVIIHGHKLYAKLCLIHLILLGIIIHFLLSSRLQKTFKGGISQQDRRNTYEALVF